MLDVDVSITYETLADAGRGSQSLDDKLRAAITDVCAGELGKDLNRAAEEEKAKFRRPLAGRQMLRLIYVYFQTKQSLNQVYGLTNLMKVTYLGDKNMEQFYNSWLKVLNNLKSPESVSDEARKELFLKACEQSLVLKNDVDHYKRQAVGHPDKSYDFLVRSIKFRIDSAREDRNCKELDNTFAGSSAMPAMPSAEGLQVLPEGVMYQRWRLQVLAHRQGKRSGQRGERRSEQCSCPLPGGQRAERFQR